MHDLPHLPYHINGWTCECMLMAYQSKKWKETLIQLVKGKQTIKLRNRHSKTKQQIKIEAHDIKEIRNKRKKLELGFQGMSMCAHTQGLHMQPSCMSMHTQSMRTHAGSMCMHTHLKP